MKKIRKIMDLRRQGVERRKKSGEEEETTQLIFDTRRGAMKIGRATER